MSYRVGVLAVGVLGICTALTAASSQTQSTDIDARSLAITRKLMEEICARPFDRALNETLPTPNCIADYDGLHRTTAALGSDAKSVADTLSYSSEVQVQNRSSAAGPFVPDGDLALITIVTTPSAKAAPVTLHRLVSRYTQARN